MSEHGGKPNLGRKTIPLVLVIFGMGGMAWAAVPLYDWFCRVTGYGGTTQQATQGADRVLDRTVTVRFTGSVSREMPWQFRPVESSMKIRIGETALAFYEAYNPTDHAVAGTANFNVTPFSVGGYFAKIDCFCFTKQVLGPGERTRMPVTFYIDPKMVDDAEAKGVGTITLSYTFFETELDKQAAVDKTTANKGAN